MNPAIAQSLYSPQTAYQFTALDEALALVANLQAKVAELELAVETDSTTGLLNKRGFMRALEREQTQALRRGTPTAVLVLFDLDGLKQINDTHGHLAGDAYIAAFAVALQQNVRGTDYVARLGGDEFAVILTDCSPAQGLAKAQKLSTELNRMPFRYRGHAGLLCTSMGAAVIMPGHDAESLIHEADSKLYANKRMRKTQRVVLA